MVFYSKRIIILRSADLSDFVSLIFVGKMCVFVSRPMKFVTFLRRNGDHPKRVVDFPLERDTFRNKIMEIADEFDEKSSNNNGKPLKSSKILRVKPNFFIFLDFSSFFFIFFRFFSFFHFFIFSFFSFFIFLLLIIFIFPFFHFFHFSSFFIFLSFFFFFSSFFLHFLHYMLSFFFFYFSGCSKSDFFLASIASRFLVTFLFR